MNKKIKNAFSEICVSEKLERNILNMTVNKEKRALKNYKLSYVCSIALVICMVSVSIVYAAEIKAFFENWSTSIRLEDGTEIKISENNTYKQIPNNAPKTYKTEDDIGTISMTHKEIEDVLGFDILKYENVTNDIIGYRTSLNKDKSIGRVDLWWANFINEENGKSLSVSISILNKNADEGYVLAFEEGIDATGGKNIENSYKSNNLNTDVIIYTNNWDSSRITATFVYDNVLYQYIGHNFTKDEIISIIESLK